MVSTVKSATGEKMTTVQKEKVARRKLTLLQLGMPAPIPTERYTV